MGGGGDPMKARVGDLVRIGVNDSDRITGILIRFTEPQPDVTPWHKFHLLTAEGMQETWLHTTEFQFLEVISEAG